jgi:hypothetical protein
MGFYYGVERFRRAGVGFDPVLTPREYAAAVAQAMRLVLRGEGDPDPSRGTPNGSSSPFSTGVVQAFVGRVRQCPTDAQAHRLLGAALLDAGSPRAGVRHLGIALRLLLADASARGSLHGSLCARLQIGLLLIPLISSAARPEGPALLKRVIGILP